jgi:hypothetical protein
VASVTEGIRKGTRVTGQDRDKLAADLKDRYDSGESIRALAVSTGRSYGFIHRLLKETGVTLRGAHGTTRAEIPVQIYLEDAAAGPRVEESLREVLLTSGVEYLREIRLVLGSWYRSLTGLLKRAADSDTAAEARRAVELQVLERFQAGIDGVTGDAVAKLIGGRPVSQTLLLCSLSHYLVKSEFILDWRPIAQFLLNTLTVVVHLDKLERCLPDVRDILPYVQVDELFLERRVPRFGCGIVIADTCPPDRRDDAVIQAGIAELNAGILATAV